MLFRSVIALLPRLQTRTEKINDKRIDSNGLANQTSSRVQEAIEECKSFDGLLGQFREIIVGPVQRLGEARFEELLEILEEQDDSIKTELESIKSAVNETEAGARRLGELCLQINDRICEVAKKSSSDLEESKIEIKAAMEAINTQLSKVTLELESKLDHRLLALARESKRELNTLSQAHDTHVKETEKMFLEVRDSGVSTIEQRIAQWRAEMADERRDDIDKQIGRAHV